MPSPTPRACRGTQGRPGTQRAREATQGRRDCVLGMTVERCCPHLVTLPASGARLSHWPSDSMSCADSSRKLFLPIALCSPALCRHRQRICRTVSGDGSLGWAALPLEVAQ